MLAGVAFGSLAAPAFSTRSRWPSADTSKWRDGFGSAYLVSNSFAGLPMVIVGSDVSTGTAVSAFEASR